ncbi:MAG: heat-inducible transcriptional repressor HrcA [Clostridia bacterium]|nr:heat-inducible transcriptional repressor HrcA [Clostridia bacterium]
MEDKLTERKKKVLQALVDEYITNVEPISSADIQAKYLPDVSTATIRSELSHLEEMGYLIKPHVSAGRAPSSKAYRYYVENFVEDNIIDLEQLRKNITKKYNSVVEIVRDGAKIVSDVTNYTSMLMITNSDTLTIKDVKLLDMYDGTALVLIITDSGVIKDKEIKLPKIEDNYVEVANGLLNKSFAGKTLSQIVNSQVDLDAELKDFKQIFEKVIDVLSEYKKSRDGQLFVEGADKIFEYPESKNYDNIKNFMTIVGRKDKLTSLMKDDGDIEFSIKIGAEDGEGLDNMALVSAKYHVKGKEVGQLGVIGPERMDYKKVLSVLKQLGKIIDNLDE